MRKKTVITTEKSEVWVIRDGLSGIEAPLDPGRVIEMPTSGEDLPKVKPEDWKEIAPDGNQE